MTSHAYFLTLSFSLTWTPDRDGWPVGPGIYLFLIPLHWDYKHVLDFLNVGSGVQSQVLIFKLYVGQFGSACHTLELI